MKKLILVRHGKAEASNGLDFNRNLTSIGEERSQEVALSLKTMKVIPELIVTSAARRTYQTAEYMADILWGKREGIIEIQELYLADAEIIKKHIQAAGDKIESIMVVGHNPGMSELVTQLAGKGIYGLKTSGTVIFEMEVDTWTNFLMSQTSPRWHQRVEVY